MQFITATIFIAPPELCRKPLPSTRRYSSASSEATKREPRPHLLPRRSTASYLARGRESPSHPAAFPTNGSPPPGRLTSCVVLIRLVFSSLHDLRRPQTLLIRQNFHNEIYCNDDIQRSKLDKTEKRYISRSNVKIAWKTQLICDGWD